MLNGANLTVTDLYCGGGGSSTGMVTIQGVQVITAANHWDRAIETHNANHPDTKHLQADISQVRPQYIPHTDILWISPECTNHSLASGRSAFALPDENGEVLVDAAIERSRATMWDAVRFAEVHGYRAIIVENVVEVLKWTGAGARVGALFDAWLKAMHALGYQHQVVSLNSMHAQAYGMPAPQSRDRVYIVLWKTGERAPDLQAIQRPLAWCPACEQVVESLQTWKRPGTVAGRYRAQYVYTCPKRSCGGQQVEPGWLPAWSIIDWSLPGTRIGDRTRPLADKTMRRIQKGIDRFWGPTQGGHPLAVPAEGRAGKSAAPMSNPLRTQTTRAETGMALPPFFAELRGGGSTARLASDPLATLTAAGNHHGLVMPYYGHGTTRSIDDALATLTTVDRHALLTPAGGTWNDQARITSDPMPSLTTREAFALVMRNNSGGAEMTTPVYEALRTLTTGAHQSLLVGGTPNIEDVLFRMLEPSEAKRAMGFETDYIMLGNRREQVRLAGNAVTPPAARDLMGAISLALTGYALAA